MTADPSLLETYRKAIYTIPEFEVDILIDKKNPNLDKALKALKSGKVKSWVFITADNPHSRMRSSAENTRAFLVLEERIKKSEHVYYEGWAKSIRNDWPPEHALLILDISEEEALQIAVEFDQKAMVTGELGKNAKLVEV
jgi:hypothetical protein